MFAERGGCERRDRHAQNHSVLVDVQGNFGEGEFFELALGIGNIAAVKAGGKRGFEIRGDEIVLRFFTSIDVKARANLHDHGDLERTAASGRIERGVDFRLDDFAAGRNLGGCDV